MKGVKIDKAPVIEKDLGKNDSKNMGKVTSPRNKLTKGLGLYKSQKDLTKGLTKNDLKSQDNSEVSGGSEIVQNVQTTVKGSVRAMKESLKEEIRTANSPKIPNELLSPKSQAQRFFRSKNSLPEKQDDKTKKILQQKDDKLEELSRKNQQLQTKIQILAKQKQKTDQIIEQFKLEKQSLEKNVEKLRNVAQQNRKLLRQKAQGFNTNGNEIKNLRAQLDQLTMVKKSSILCSSQIGINTQPQEQKLSQTGPENISIQSRLEQQSNPEVSLNTSNELKTPSSQQTTDYTTLLHTLQEGHNFSFEDNLKFSVAANLFEKVIREQNKVIQEREETIYELQRELNQVYESRDREREGWTGGIKVKELGTNEIMLMQAKENQQLKQALSQKEKSYCQIKEELWNKQRELENLKRELQVKQILYKADMSVGIKSKLMESKLEASFEAESASGALEMRRELQNLKRIVSQGQFRIKELEAKNGQQELIIKSLKDKRPKIVK